MNSISRYAWFLAASVKICGAVFGAGVLCALSCCTSTQQGAQGNSQQAVGDYVGTIMLAVRQSAPWKDFVASSDNPIEPKLWEARQRKYEFKQGIDDPNALLFKAREGDDIAMAKLEFYIMQLDSNWPSRFEVNKMLALRRGVSGIAKFYAETKRNRRLKVERQMIEQALRQLEKKAFEGSWVHAVALYQFCGSLDQTDERLPWDDNEALSAKWLELLYSELQPGVFKNIVSNESRRLGFGHSMAINGEFYPHTPTGWKPGLKR